MSAKCPAIGILDLKILHSACIHQNSFKKLLCFFPINLLVHRNTYTENITKDVLSPRKTLSLWTSCPWVVLSQGQFVPRDVSPKNLLCVRMFCLVTFVSEHVSPRPFCLWTFCLCINGGSLNVTMHHHLWR